MGKKFIKKLLVLMAAMCMVIGMALPVQAVEGDEAGTAVTATTEDPSNGILQVMLAYVDDEGVRSYYTAGTCFLINEEYVITNKHIFDLDTDMDPDPDVVYTIRELVMDGEGLDELADNDPHLKLYVFANRDTNVEATVHENAQSDVLDFAALHLSEKIYGREPLVLGDSDAVQQRDDVFAYGFPADSISNKNFNTKDDVSISSGIVSKVTVTGSVDIIEHTSQLDEGNSGGPLVNDVGEVVGINEFIVDQKNYSIQINVIKEILDTWGIPYTGGTGGSTGGGTEPTELTVEDLQSKIDTAKALSLDGYTEESVKAFQDAIAEAESVAAGSPDSAAIQSAIDAISAAQSGLVKEETEPVAEEETAEGPNWFLIGGIIAIVVIVIVVVIIIIVVVNGNKKKKAKQAPPVQQKVTPPVQQIQPNTPPVSPVQPGGYPTMPQDDGAGETTLLDSGAGETTLLGGGMGGAYLIRKKNGEKIPITSQNFAIGKERRRVNYCISDNTSVSRYHVVIMKKGSDYYAADQKSSNFTFVNGVQLSPYQETLLTDRSTLKLSDEEFEFHVS
ncbi:MAG TPA: trypsin-like peptidase domain-containing protein [Candidatus Mediterraneibacter faecipullorum]|uniref:Trypsin-like peptidase domain-containing protein n=1 Tax=Candidatus Mediterraneibacter faecipullorum TaxID=2838670 RepID=A0A9D2STL3_9FIRM|nr:trypsin-like peptidase domain-containing protein [Candidatus Mediterraneibacter faecipullorum]